MVREFHEAMDQPVDQPFSDTALINLRYRLIDEEVLEATEAGEKSLPKDELLKELADIIYVVYGFAVSFGWDLDEAVRRVHESNMSKLYPDGKPRYREDGKVLKSPNYEAPDLKDLVNG